MLWNIYVALVGQVMILMLFSTIRSYWRYKENKSKKRKWNFVGHLMLLAAQFICVVVLLRV